MKKLYLKESIYSCENDIFIFEIVNFADLLHRIPNVKCDEYNRVWGEPETTHYLYR